MKVNKIYLIALLGIIICMVSGMIPRGMGLCGRTSDTIIDPVGDAYFHMTISAGSSIYGYFDVHDPTEEVSIYLMDSTNYDLYTQGKAYTRHVDMRDNAGQYSFTASSTKEYYIVYHNTYLFDPIELDTFFDNEEIYLPDYNNHDYYSNYNLLATESYYGVAIPCEEEDILSGNVQSPYLTDYMDIFFCDWQNYQNLAVQGAVITKYNLHTDVNSQSLSFAVPSTGTWYLVIESMGEEDAVSFAYYLDVIVPTPTSSSTTTTPPPGISVRIPGYSGFIFCFLLGIVGVVYLIRKRVCGRLLT